MARIFQNLALPPRTTVADSLLLGRHRPTRAGFVAAGSGCRPAVHEERGTANGSGDRRVRRIADQLATPTGALALRAAEARRAGSAPCAWSAAGPAHLTNLSLDDRRRTPPHRRRHRGRPRQLSASPSSWWSTTWESSCVSPTRSPSSTSAAGSPGSPEQVQNDPAVIQAYLGAPRRAGGHRMSDVSTFLELLLNGVSIAPSTPSSPSGSWSSSGRPSRQLRPRSPAAGRRCSVTASPTTTSASGSCARRLHRRRRSSAPPSSSSCGATARPQRPRHRVTIGVDIPAHHRTLPAASAPTFSPSATPGATPRSPSAGSIAHTRSRVRPPPR